MSIVAQVLTEDCLSLKQAQVEIEQATGRKVDISTLHRWIHRGVKSNRLEAVKIGYQVVTSRQAITRFFEATTAKGIGN